MSIAEEGTVAEETQLTDQELEDAAFMAAFTSEDDDDTPLESVTAAEESEPEAEADDLDGEESGDAEGTEDKPVREEVIEGFTAEELKIHLAEIPKLRKQLDTVHGKFGQRFADQSKQIEALRNRPTATAASKLSPDAFKRLKEEFPELGSLLAEELESAMVPGGPAFDPTVLQEQVEQSMTAYEKKVQAKSMKRLVKKFPDWEQTAGYTQDEATGFSTWNNPEFGEWVTKQPIEVQQEITTTDDPLDLLDHLNDFEKFKKSQEKSAKQSPTVPSIPVVKKTSKQVFGKAIKAPSVAGAEKALTAKEEEDRAFLAAMMDETI